MTSLLLSACLAAFAPVDAAETPSAALEAYRQQVARSGHDAASEVKLALWCESHGLAAERTKHLARAVILDPKNATARGLMGMMEYRGRWETPEAAAAKARVEETRVALLAEYNQRRDRLNGLDADPRTLARAHDELGHWCQENGLAPEAKAHYTQSVVLNPYRESTWKAMGYVKHNGRWQTPDQAAAEDRETVEQHTADRRWEPALRRLRSQLNDPAKAPAALQELAAVIDPRVVPMVVRLFFDASEPCQGAAIDVLSRIDTPEATKALARLAVMTTYDRIRGEASERLRSREARDYGGLLVDNIHSVMRYQVQHVGGPGQPGALLIETPRMKMIRTYDAPEVVKFSGQFYGWYGIDQNGLPSIIRGAEMSSSEAQKNPQAVIAKGEARAVQLITEANLKAAASQQVLAADVKAIEVQNARAESLNTRLVSVLQQSLDAPNLKDDETAWQSWWYDRVGYKYEAPPQILVAQNASPQYPPATIASCFAAGTLVHTLDGRRPIETLRVGDQVLSQDAATGALAYRPITVVHHNPPAETVVLKLDDETITASVYHRFYRVGKGWAMARELRPGDVLRTLHGPARVATAESGAKVPVYNLDVAETKTFFVGLKDALVHDNTLPEPREKNFDVIAE